MSPRDSYFFDLAVAIERGDKEAAFYALDLMTRENKSARRTIEAARFSPDARRVG